MDERSEYEEIIKENLDYDILCQDPKLSLIHILGSGTKDVKGGKL